MILVLFFAYQINFVIFPALCLTLALYEAGQRLLSLTDDLKENKKLIPVLVMELKEAMKNLAPVFICVVLVAPFLIFFETFDAAARATAFYKLNSDTYINSITRVFTVFRSQEFLYAVLFAKALQIVIWYLTKNEKKKENVLERMTFFMTVFFICFCLMVGKMPLLWERYFIVLQPVMILILLTDIVIIFKYISTHFKNSTQRFAKIIFGGALIFVFTINSEIKINFFKNYLYQITHQYKGPLDYLIPYIKENYKNTDTLVVATNYEELSYVYFLNCKVTIGYINKNIKEDMNYQPDIIIFRKKWGHNPYYFNQLIQKAQYKRISFPVFDYPVNDIAELEFGIQHQFKTNFAQNESDKTDILVRVK